MTMTNTDIFARHRSRLLAFGEQFDHARLIPSRLALLARGPLPDAVAIIGMGGSGLAGDMAKLLVAENAATLPPIVVWKDYGLPTRAELLPAWKRPFFIFCSFSGNTEETLSGVRRAVEERGRNNVAVVTSGGALGRLADRYRLPMVSFDPGDLTPRESLGYSTNSLLLLLRTRFPSLRDLPRPAFPPDIERRAAAIAREMGQAVPLVYTDAAFRTIGYFWKISFNETAKRPAFSNVFPETDHNEIEGFERRPRSPFFGIFIERPGTEKRVRTRMALTKRELARHGVPGTTVALPGRNRAERAWNGVCLSYWVSHFVARADRVDPIRTELIEDFKKRMRRA